MLLGLEKLFRKLYDYLDLSLGLRINLGAGYKNL